MVLSLIFRAKTKIWGGMEVKGVGWGWGGGGGGEGRSEGVRGGEKLVADNEVEVYFVTEINIGM